MNYDNELTEELQANKALFDSTEGIDAFRRQSIILDKITKQAPKPDKYALYKAHFKEYSEKQFKAFVDDRSKKVEALIRGAQRTPLTKTLSANEFLNENQISVQPSCAGKYRDCERNEVRTDDLKVFQKVLGCIPSDNVSETTSYVSDNLASCDESKSKSVRQFPFQKNAYDSKEPSFRTAREELILQNMKKVQPSSSSGSRNLFNYGASKKSLGARRNVRSGFVPPIRQQENSLSSTPSTNLNEIISTEPINEHLQNIDPKMVELITNEIMHKFKPINWNDIAGLEYAKSTIKEAVVWPLLRPDIFTGLRRPPRGILLFGPPGTGKTLIGKCIASQSKSTFFSISASSLTSKWIGEGEKMVRALFAVAAVHQPSVIFIDEIDSLLSQRSETEHESSRRLKTEFLVQLDGANTTGDERILIVGATNRPKELDEAARRRLVRRLYISLPELPARIQILTNLLQKVRNTLSTGDIEKIGTLTDGYSGADMENLCREASMEPIRSIPPDEIPFFDEESVRPVTVDDFEFALMRVRATVSPEDINQYVEWDRTYGAGQ